MALDAARRITEAEGLRALRGRQVARDIGYTIGTLYNLFEDFDDLVVRMNAETLDELFETCAAAPISGDAETDLAALAQRYLQFTRTHPKLWSAIFEYQPPAGQRFPDWYSEKVVRLILLEQRALAPIFPKGHEAEAQHHAQVLWTSLFGMAAVESAGRLPKGVTADSLVRSLIEIYIAGLGRAKPNGNTGKARP